MAEKLSKCLKDKVSKFLSATFLSIELGGGI